MDELGYALEDVGDDDSNRVLVVSGAGRHFAPLETWKPCEAVVSPVPGYAKMSTTLAGATAGPGGSC